MRTQIDLERTPDSAAQARRALSDVADHLTPRRLEDARLLVSELVTNAVKYGSGPVELHVETGDDLRSRFTISDAGGGDTPAVREAGGRLAGGYGLHLVDRIADDWGVKHASMHVWFDLG